MKKSMLVVLAVMLLALFSLSVNAQVVSDSRTLVLSNELGPGNQGGLSTGSSPPDTGARTFTRYCSFWRHSRAPAYRLTL